MKKEFLLLLMAILSSQLSCQNPCAPVYFYWNGGGNQINNSLSPSLGTCNNFDLILKTNDTARITINADGRLFMGKRKIEAGHIHANSYLQIDGKVACKELVVVDPHKWADYVFQKNYRLAPLNEVEAYYLLNKHLPNIPDEATIKKDGINLAEMDALLLQKIEELTIYVVELNKKVEVLEAENRKLKKIVAEK
ncbi:MAG: hypothetical protein IT236_10920 [Bacteroidia bacterium]|nr:hypothetical protein [Bacteroidia bacterium]